MFQLLHEDTKGLPEHRDPMQEDKEPLQKHRDTLHRDTL